MGWVLRFGETREMGTGQIGNENWVVKEKPARSKNRIYRK